MVRLTKKSGKVSSCTLLDQLCRIYSFFKPYLLYLIAGLSLIPQFTLTAFKKVLLIGWPLQTEQ